MYITGYIATMNGIFIALNFKNYGITRINDDYFITIVGACYLIFSSISSLFWGFITNFVNFKKSF